MAKKYKLVSFSPGTKDNGKVVTSNLFNLSAISMTNADKLIKHSLAVGASETAAEATDFLGGYNMTLMIFINKLKLLFIYFYYK